MFLKISPPRVSLHPPLDSVRSPSKLVLRSQAKETALIMQVREELLISKPMEPGQELLLSILLCREYVTRISDEKLFKPAGITDQQFNVLRILKGGPVEGYLIRELRRRIISRSADVPRLVERMVRAGLVGRREDPSDRRGCLVRLTAEGEALEARLAPIHSELCREVASFLDAAASRELLDHLQAFRDGVARKLEKGE